MKNNAVGSLRLARTSRGSTQGVLYANICVNLKRADFTSGADRTTTDRRDRRRTNRDRMTSALYQHGRLYPLPIIAATILEPLSLPNTVATCNTCNQS